MAFMTEATPKDFDYEFDPERIGLKKSARRSASRLMVVSRSHGEMKHDHFTNLGEYLKSGDLLVVNSTRVMNARFLGEKKTGGQIEGLFLEAAGENCRVWLQGRVKPHERLTLRGGFEVEVLERAEKEAILRVSLKDFSAYLAEHGLVPLPPYIRTERVRSGMSEIQPEDAHQYQSEFAKSEALSVAAPTASLHFDESLLKSLESRGVQISEVSLAVGAGTFEPLKDELALGAQHLHRESVRISAETQEAIGRAKGRGSRVIAVGTTVLRALESGIREQNWGAGAELHFSTDIFVRPGFEFKVVDGLITNFHWPKSSLLVLVASFLEPACAQPTRWRAVYESAVSEKYRLFSFGDGMLIL